MAGFFFGERAPTRVRTGAWPRDGRGNNGDALFNWGGGPSPARGILSTVTFLQPSRRQSRVCSDCLSDGFLPRLEPRLGTTSAGLFLFLSIGLISAAIDRL